jgi:hypothetical protein
MNVISVVSIGLSASFLIAGAVLFFLSRRGSSPRQSIDGNRDRAVMDDRGDRVIWETGQGWPLVNKEADAMIPTRRAFFARAALGSVAAIVSWRLARGSADTRLLEKIGRTNAPGTPSPLKGAGHGTSVPSTGAVKEMAFFQQDHSDSHQDFEVHGDDLLQHQDATNPRGMHYDIPHGDGGSTHFDTHSDCC